MPLYEYQCENCGETFEAMQKFADAPLTVHEKCGGPVHRLISAPALQFKGSGWYITDYAKSGGDKTATNGDSKKSESGDGSSKKETSTTKTESSSSSKSSESSTSSTTSKSTSDKN